MGLAQVVTADECLVEPYAGDNAYGPTYGAALRLPCKVDPSDGLVRTATGDEVAAEMTLMLLPVAPELDTDVEVETYEVCAPESRVTVGDRTAVVKSRTLFRVKGRLLYVEVKVA